MIKTKELREPIYELEIGGRGKYCALFAEVYSNNGNRDIASGKYLVTEFWRLGSLKKIRRDEKGYFEDNDLEKLIVEVEKEWPGSDTQGKPFFVNAFMFTRMTGRSKIETYPLKEADGSIEVVDGKQINTWITWHESPIEFYQIEVDKKKRIKR